MAKEEKKTNGDFQKLKFIGIEEEEEITLDDGRVVSQITVEEFKDHPRTLFFRPMTKKSEVDNDNLVNKNQDLVKDLVKESEVNNEHIRSR